MQEEFCVFEVSLLAKCKQIYSEAYLVYIINLLQKYQGCKVKLLFNLWIFF